MFWEGWVAPKEVCSKLTHGCCHHLKALKAVGILKVKDILATISYMYVAKLQLVYIQLQGCIEFLASYIKVFNYHEDL